MKFLLSALACCTLFAAPGLHLSDGPGVQAALDHISADSMRANLSFLASDALEGRDTPSRGLDVAAEFIASRFRQAGLEAPVESSYFQTAEFVELTRRTDGIALTVDHAGQVLRFAAPDVTITRTNAALNIEAAPLYKLSGEPIPDEVAGKMVLVRFQRGSLLRDLSKKKPALILAVTSSATRDRRTTTLVDAEQVDVPSVPVVFVHGESGEKLLGSLPDGPTKATLSLQAPAPRRVSVKLRNVIGVLRGSDPAVRDTYILVTAHYDHLGIKRDADGENVYSGANDDGSGVVSVIELAEAMSRMQPRPRRSIVFMTLFGEEKDLLGSSYYERHPVFPLNRTVADINIEQVGRTDDSAEPQIAAATLTGFTYSNVPALFAEAGKAEGVKVHDRNPGKDPYFDRSDNVALAEAGVPSHTVAVALDFPDYHQVGDKWNKIDYNNMTMIDRMLALGIISLANDPVWPRWNESNQNTQKYVTAWKSLHPAEGN